MPAEAGHGALLWIEKVGAGTGVFSVIGGLIADIKEPGVTRPESDITPHNADIDVWLPGVRQRESVTFGVAYDYTDETHDEATGLKAYANSGATFGIRFTGPGWTSGSDNTFVASGFITAFSVNNPVKEGPRMADVTMRLSGPYIDNGVVVGTIA